MWKEHSGGKFSQILYLFSALFVVGVGGKEGGVGGGREAGEGRI